MARDVFGNVTDDNGTLHFTSTDAAATLPPDSAISGGSGMFSATLMTLGSQTITATDEVNHFTGPFGTITVTKAPNLVVTTAADDAGDAANCTPQPAPGTGTDSACSLRDAISYVNKNGGIVSFDSKVFAASNSAAQNTITLASTLPINQGMTIQGPGANVVTVSGNNAVTVFTINYTGPVSVSGLTIANGLSNINTNGGNGGGVYNAGILTVSGCNFSNNHTPGDSVMRLPVYDNGGAIHNANTLFVSNSTFYGNIAYGTTFGLDNFAVGNGGAISNFWGRATITNSTFVGNSAATAPGDPRVSGAGGAIGNFCSTVTISDSTLFGQFLLHMRAAGSTTPLVMVW